MASNNNSLSGILTDRNFTENDFFAELLNARPGIVERLSSLHPYFAHVAEFGLCEQKKSANLGEAARWAGISIETFLSFVNCGAGLSVQFAGDEAGPLQEEPSWLVLLKGDGVIELDVRPDLASKSDPFKRVMTQVHKLGAGEGFRLVAPFNPIPLRGVLAERGMSSHAEQVGNGSWVVYFHAVEKPKLEEADAEGAESVQVTNNAAHLDVRSLEPPQPLVKILTVLDGPDPVDELFVRIHREPVFLFPELAERGWEYEVQEHHLNGEEEEFLLRLKKSRSAA